MCGINGIITKEKNINKTIQCMNELLAHRGPDSQGIEIYSDVHLGLGHVRLSILDLSNAGHQPMSYSKELGCSSSEFKPEHGSKSNLSLIFNGEIYNYKEIKIDLIKKGYTFKSNTDSEVILAAYDLRGSRCVEHFNGMRAFTLYDKDKELLFCSRDRLGIKPFYYYNSNKIFTFSSEIQSLFGSGIERNLNINMISTYLSFHYTASEYTLIEGIKKLPAGHNLIYSIKKNNFSIEKYRDINPRIINDNYSLENEIEILNGIISDSVKIRTETSDVPVGTFLSGGLDSSITTAIFKKYYTGKEFHSFTVVREKELQNEGKFAKIVANHIGSIHHTIPVTGIDVLNSLEDLQRHYSDPIAEGGFIPNYFVSRYASNRVKVVLTGDGADELLGGYSYYGFMRKFRKIGKIPGVRFISKIMKSILPNGKLKKGFNFLSYAKNEKYPQFFSGVINVFSDDEISNLLNSKINNNENIHTIKKTIKGFSSIFKQLLYTDIKVLLQNCYNLKPDHALMAHQIEGRAPLQDYRIAEYSFKKSDSLLINKGKEKYILSEIAKLYLPKSILNRKKQGYGVPLFHRLNNELKTTVLSSLNSSILVKEKYINPEILEKYLNNIHKEKYAIKIWTLFCLEFYIKQLKLNVKKI